MKFDIFEDSADNEESMRQVRFQKNHPFFQVLFWGSLWGLTEASLGHLFHLLKVPGLAGFFMFPIGLYFMLHTLKTTEKTSAVPAVAAVAASLKLVDFFLPGTHLFQAVNPALAILSESLAFLFVIKIIRHPSGLFRYQSILSAAFGWRLIYAAFQISLAVIFSESTSFLHLGPVTILRFFFLDSLVNVLIIAGVQNVSSVRISPRWKLPRSPHPALSLALCLFAILATIALR
jgi:hypothetical protein